MPCIPSMGLYRDVEPFLTAAIEKDTDCVGGFRIQAIWEDVTRRGFSWGLKQMRQNTGNKHTRRVATTFSLSII
ncbi:hypothetical protein MCRY_21545 [Marivita cryptomonadis]|nr:hypothetical protein MCRY_21545 [Marivita cryptomonadis]